MFLAEKVTQLFLLGIADGVAWAPQDPGGDALILPTAIQTLLGVGVPAGFSIAFSLWLARGAIAKAVNHAAARELVRLKSSLDAELEDHKKRLQLEVQQQQSLLQKDLERFRAELTLAAETRRLLAAHKVSSFIEVVRLARELHAELETVALGDPLSRKRMTNVIGTFADFVRAHEHFLGEVAKAELLSQSDTLASCLNNGTTSEQLRSAAAIFRNAVVVLSSTNLGSGKSLD